MTSMIGIPSSNLVIQVINADIDELLVIVFVIGSV